MEPRRLSPRHTATPRCLHAVDVCRAIRCDMSEQWHATMGADMRPGTSNRVVLPSAISGVLVNGLFHEALGLLSCTGVTQRRTRYYMYVTNAASKLQIHGWSHCRMCNVAKARLPTVGHLVVGCDRRGLVDECLAMMGSQFVHRILWMQPCTDDDACTGCQHTYNGLTFAPS